MSDTGESKRERERANLIESKGSDVNEYYLNDDLNLGLLGSKLKPMPERKVKKSLSAQAAEAAGSFFPFEGPKDRYHIRKSAVGESQDAPRKEAFFGDVTDRIRGVPDEDQIGRRVFPSERSVTGIGDGDYWRPSDRDSLHTQARFRRKNEISIHNLKVGHDYYVEANMSMSNRDYWRSTKVRNSEIENTTRAIAKGFKRLTTIKEMVDSLVQLLYFDRGGDPNHRGLIPPARGPDPFKVAQKIVHWIKRITGARVLNPTPHFDDLSNYLNTFNIRTDMETMFYNFGSRSPHSVDPPDTLIYTYWESPIAVFSSLELMNKTKKWNIYQGVDGEYGAGKAVRNVNNLGSGNNAEVYLVNYINPKEYLQIENSAVAAALAPGAPLGHMTRGLGEESLRRKMKRAHHALCQGVNKKLIYHPSKPPVKLFDLVPPSTLRSAEARAFRKAADFAATENIKIDKDEYFEPDWMYGYVGDSTTYPCSVLGSGFKFYKLGRADAIMAKQVLKYQDKAKSRPHIPSFLHNKVSDFLTHEGGLRTRRKRKRKRKKTRRKSHKRKRTRRKRNRKKRTRKRK